MKITKINKNLRILFIVVLILVLSVTSLLFYNYIANPVIIEEEIPMYTYSNKTNVSYEVFLRPNILINDRSVGEDQIYFLEFTEYINATFNYVFSGQEAANISGNYEIVARVEGYETEKESETTLWKKDFIIVPEKFFTATDKNITVKEQISFSLDGYNEFAMQVIEATKTRPLTRLSIIMNVDLDADTNNSMIEVNKPISLIMPLGESHYQITKVGIGNEEGVKNIVEETTLPINKRLVILYSLLITIFIGALIYLILFTEVVTEDEFEKRIKSLLKKHGDHMVALTNDIESDFDSAYIVNSMHDLVKIADEIEKPILYRNSIDIKNITKFYVMDNLTVYIYEVDKLVEEDGEVKESVNVEV